MVLKIVISLTGICNNNNKMSSGNTMSENDQFSNYKFVNILCDNTSTQLLTDK